MHKDSKKSLYSVMCVMHSLQGQTSATRILINVDREIQLITFFTHSVPHFSSWMFDWFQLVIRRSSHWKCFVKKMFLKISQNSQENTCVWFSPEGQQLYQKETPSQVIPYKIYKIFKQNYLEEHLLTTASGWIALTFWWTWWIASNLQLQNESCLLRMYFNISATRLFFILNNSGTCSFLHTATDWSGDRRTVKCKNSFWYGYLGSPSSIFVDVFI